MELLTAAVNEVTSIDSTFLQYGILGIVALLLGYFSWTQYKRLVAKNDSLEIKIEKLQEEMISLLGDERDRLARLIEQNTQALQEIQRTIIQYVINNRQDHKD